MLTEWVKTYESVPCVVLAGLVRVCRLLCRLSSYEATVNLFEQTTVVLEWPRLLEALAGHARSTMGATRCRALELANDLHDAQRRQQETTEMGQIQGSGEVLPALSFPDIRDPLVRAKKGAVLEVHELRDCAMVLELLEENSRFMRRHQHDAPALTSAASPLLSIDALRPLTVALDAAIHPDGSIKESATPELRRVTHQAQGLKQEMRHRVDQMLHSRRYEEIIQEKYGDLLQTPNLVAVHIRASHPEHNWFYGLQYFRNAMDQFPDDWTFAVFSDQPSYLSNQPGYLKKPYYLIYHTHSVLTLEFKCLVE